MASPPTSPSNGTSPVTLDGLKSGDPLDPKVRQWWKNKAAEIYTAIPDFGGFLVKANSEGRLVRKIMAGPTPTAQICLPKQ